MSGKVGMATVKRSWIFCKTSWSGSDETNEMARPLVPKRPARPTRCRYESASAGASYLISSCRSISDRQLKLARAADDSK